MIDQAPPSVSDRIGALRTAERAASGNDLSRIRRQIAMLSEADRKPAAFPAQRRKFA